MSGHLSYRGGPLIALVVVLLSWVVLRVLISVPSAPVQTQSPIAGSDALYQALLAANAPHDWRAENAERRDALALTHSSQDEPNQPQYAARSSASASDITIELAPITDPMRQRELPPVIHVPPERIGTLAVQDHVPTNSAPRSERPSGAYDDIREAVDPARHDGALNEPSSEEKHIASQEFVTPKWSADGWYLLRSGGGGVLGSGAQPSTYGASQVGGVLRYRLDTQSSYRPEVYARVAAAVNTAQDREAALGLSARPFAAIPVRGAVELRISDNQTGTSLRPVAMAITEIAPFALPYQSRAEFYAQAGYVGGQDATAFIDGQARFDRSVLWLRGSEIRAGLGFWGGAQKGASRFDIGPSATLGLMMGQRVSARLGLDWRMRVAGNAKPDTGLALTLFAGF